MFKVTNVPTKVFPQFVKLSGKRNIGSCCVKPYFDETVHGDSAFSVRSVNIKFGKKILPETGDEVLNLFSTHNTNGKRVGIFTDKKVRQLHFFGEVTTSLKKSGIDFVIYDEVRVEPNDVSFMNAAHFVKESNIDLAISIGGGSVMDTAKAAILYGKHPPPNDDFLYYVNAPVGYGNPVKGRLIPHIAIPTTSGTGSECTGFAICSIKHHPTAPNSKTGIASAALCPTMAIIDPTVTYSLPLNVIAASGFDVLSHALESYTARPYTKRPKANPPHLRPLNQGANPYADFGCIEALRICAQYFERAMTDESDLEAREQMMWAATLAGTVMGNVGVHLPHGLSYPLSGNVRSYYPPEGYAKTHPLIPHGMGVILCAPAAFRFTAPACPDRHLNCCSVLGLNVDGVDEKDSGDMLSDELVRLIKVAKFPNGINEVGFSIGDVEMLSKACYQQKRVVDNSPLPVSELDIQHMYKGNLSHW